MSMAWLPVALRRAAFIRSQHPIASAPILVAVVVLGSCIGEPALDEERPVSISIKTPVIEGEIVFSAQDASMLDLEQRRWDIGMGRDRGSTSITTGLTQTSGQKPEYCFSEPVMLESPSGSERLLIQAGECFEGTTVIDRQGVRFLSPDPGAVVGDALEVRIVEEVGTPDSWVRFLVDGELSTRGVDAEGRATLDLAGVAPGPVAIRAEVVDPGDWVRAATVIEVVKEDGGG